MSEKIITKNAQLGENAGEPDDDALSLIAKFTRKTPQKDNIYTFSVILCDNEVDRDCERFSVDSLDTLCKMFVGVTGIFDHSMKSSDQTARVYKTQVITDENKLTSQGEKYTYLKAWCYMLRTAKNAGLIEDIDGGIKKEVSVSCSCSDRICSVCGKSLRNSECNHVVGKKYAGKQCHAVLCEPTDVYEWSFVAVPAQRNAGVSKSLKNGKNIFAVAPCNPEEIIKNAQAANGEVVLTGEQVKSLGDYLDKMKNDASAGRNVRNTAENEIIALAAFTLPDADTSMLPDILKKLSSDEIMMLRKAFGCKAEMNDSFSQSLTSSKTKTFNDNSHFKI